MKIIITTLFGLEAPTRDDLLERGFKKTRMDVKDGVITLETGPDDWALDIARVNMWARHAERVFFEVGSFKTGSSENFTEDGAVFFESCRKLPWNDYIPKGWAFIVNGFSRKSNHTQYHEKSTENHSRRRLLRGHHSRRVRGA